MIGGSQVASWRIYPRVHKDPGSVGHRAGVGQQTGERAKLSMDHPIEFLSVQNEEMALADGAAKLRDLNAEAEQRAEQKHNLTKTSWSYGRNGPATRYVVAGRMPDVRGDHRREPVVDNSIKPRPYLWDYARRSQSHTTMQDCMDGGLRAKGENVGRANFAVDPQALKAQLTRTTCRFGDGRWYGFNKRDTHSHEGAQLEANRKAALANQPLPYLIGQGVVDAYAGRATELPGFDAAASTSDSSSDDDDDEAPAAPGADDAEEEEEEEEAAPQPRPRRARDDDSDVGDAASLKCLRA